MKSFTNLTSVTLSLLGVSSLFMVSCSSVSNTYKNTLNKIKEPISDSGYNPLDKPGSRAFASRSTLADASTESSVNSNDHGFNNGDIVEVVIPNTALFAKVPKAGDRYKKVLNVGDSLRVVGGEKDFIKVVTESGETGYVSSVMVVTQGFLTQGSNVTKVDSYELPIIPDVAPEPEVKGIGEPDVAPNIVPAEVPSISAPIPIPAAPEVPELPDPGLSIPGVPSVDVPDPVPVPSIPDIDPIVPSIPSVPSIPDVAPEPSNPGIVE